MKPRWFAIIDTCTDGIGVTQIRQAAERVIVTSPQDHDTRVLYWDFNEPGPSSPVSTLIVNLDNALDVRVDRNDEM